MGKKIVPSHPRLVYVLRVGIANITPRIWRSLSVPGDYTLGDLHEILQIAFGWEEEHLHSFTVNGVEYGRPLDDDMGFGDDFDTIDEDTVSLYDLRLGPKQKFSYLYDFGDSWTHEITVSKITPLDDEDGEPERPRCLGGKRAGPLEDSGGPWGYMNMLEILKDPNHEEYEETYEWAGDFDPEYVSPEKINAFLEQRFNPPAGKRKAAGKSKQDRPK
jgi:hypothetical protein